MKKNHLPLAIILATLVVLHLSSCATIIGGSNYYAHVTVKDHPNATIEYKNSIRGKGFASIQVPRKEANKLAFVVKEEGCAAQVDSFQTRSFRTWAFVGTVIGWTGLIDGIPLPWGVATDFATGAVWKPNVIEKGITKVDYKNYNYLIDYNGCGK
jgi:hypothetical protein